MKNVKNRSTIHEQMAVFATILQLMASYGSERSFLLIFSVRDDLVKVSSKSDIGKCQNRVIPPLIDQLSERRLPHYFLDVLGSQDPRDTGGWPF